MNRIVIRQHLLPSLNWLLNQVANLSYFNEIDLLTKDYSAIPSVAELLPSFVKLRDSIEECFTGNGNKDMILLDDGGELHRSALGSSVLHSAGVEQTTSGLQQNWKYPVVLVCRSAAKLYFESQIIARGIMRKLDSIALLRGKTFGVIGLGALGSAVAHSLITRGLKVVGTETRAIPEDLLEIVFSLPDLLNRSDVILGCTGVDVLAGFNFNGFSGRKIFVSCSSSNVEFRSIMRQLPPATRFNTLSGWIGQLHCTVLNGGFPINFDRVQEWELFEEIILTRRLLLEGLIQANSMIGTSPRGIMLNPAIQQQVVLEWLERVPDSHTLRIPNSLTKRFFQVHSEGEIQITEKPKYTLHNTTPAALARMRSHKEPYETDMMGLSILVLPGVWSPAYDWSSLFYVENMPDVEGLDFLEIGCGTGAISVFAGRVGAKRIVAVDINPEAVRNALLNFERFGIENGVAFLSDGFESVSEKFDVVTWNAPYHGCSPADMLERSCADEGYRDIRRFFQQVRNYLKPGGRVVFGFSESGDLPLIRSLMAENGFRIKREVSDWRNGYNCMLFELVESLIGDP